MNQERREKAITWIKEEIRSLELAPEINGCTMTPEWAAQLDIMRTCLEAVQDHFREVTKMVPLTLEQLREMDGKPAYWLKDDSWGIISVDSAGPWAGKPFFRGRKFEVNFEYDIESRAIEVYAYQPAHIDREAWVSVKERVPNKGENVLVFAKAKYCEGQKITIDRLEEGEKNPVWLYTHGWFEVTHWFPLPEPPAELEKRLRG